MSKRVLPNEAVEHLKALIKTYDRIRKDAPTTIPRPGTDDLVEELRQQTGDPAETLNLWWTDVVQAELCVLEILDEASVRARINGWRRRMHEVIGDARYAQYIGAAPDASAAAIGLVRADLAECIFAVYYMYSSYGVAAQSRSDVTKQTFLVAFSIIALEMLATIALGFHAPPWRWWSSLDTNVVIGLQFLLAASAAAVLGSMVSVQRRLQDPTVDVDPLYRYVQMRYDRFSVAVVSPIFAAVFGMVVFGLMASGLTGGNAFPHFDKLISPHPPIADTALLLIYGFVSGFAERLVPDALNRIATRTLGSIGGGAAKGLPVDRPAEH